MVKKSESSLKTQAIKSVFWVTFSSIVSKVAMLVSMLVLVRLLSKSDFGIYGTVVTLATILLPAVSRWPDYIEVYKKVSGDQLPTWGADLVIAAFVSRLSSGNVVVVPLGNSQITQQRPEARILKQMHDAILHLQAIRLYEVKEGVDWTSV